jgi:DNA-binding SARP family transcriptional activator
MTVKYLRIYLKTFGAFELQVLKNGVSQAVKLEEYDAILLSVIRSTPQNAIPLLRLKNVLFPDRDRDEFAKDINQCIDRVGKALGFCHPRLSTWLRLEDSELSFDPSIICDADFTTLVQNREAIELLPFRTLTEQLALEKGEFLGDLSASPWVEKKRLRFVRIFQALLARQMELFAAQGAAIEAQSIAHKLLQKSPFNLSALGVLTQLAVTTPSSQVVVIPAANENRRPMSIKLFGHGQLSTLVGDTVKTWVVTGYARKLLAVLVCSPDRSSSKEVLFDTLWPRATKAQARQRLHVALHELRTSLDSIQAGYAHLVKSDRVAIRLNQELLASVDIDLLRDSAQSLGKLSMDEIDEILAATSGEFLQGERELSWITQMRRSCDHQVVKLMVRKAELLFERPQVVEAKDIAELAFEKHASNEDACALLMKCHHALGNREQAIDVFDRLRRVLRDDFDMKVSDKILSLANAIRQDEPSQTSAVPLVEMRSVLEESKELLPATAVKDRANASVAVPWEPDSVDPTSDGAYGGLRRMFLDPLVSTVWVWGPPGLGKKTLIKAVAQEFRGSLLCKIHWLDSASILEDPVASALLIESLGSSRSEIGARSRNVVIATWPTTPMKMQALADAIHLVDSRALCVFVCQEFPRVKSCVKLRATGFEAWSQRSGSIEVSSAVNAFCKFAQARGFADLVDRSTVSYLDALCKYSGGVPGILEELAERLDFSPLNLLQGWLSAQIEPVTNDLASHFDTFISRYCVFIRDAARADFSNNSRAVLEALCTVNSPISLYTLADIVGVSRFEVIASVESLVETGLVTTFRSREFDLVFVCISGLTADILKRVQFQSGSDRLLKAMVNHYVEMRFPRAEVPDKSAYRFATEILRFEYVWIETALDYALRADLQQEVIKLSRLLRRFYFDAGHIEAAAKFFSRAILSSTDTNDLADFNTVLGGLYGRAGFGRLANTHLIKAVRFARLIKDQIREATAMHSLGLSIGASGRLKRGVNFLNLASTLYLSNGLQDRELVISHGLAFLHLNELNIDYARRVLELKRPSHLANRTQSVASWHAAKGYLAYFEGDWPTAWHHVSIAIKVAEDINFVQMCFKAQLCQSMLLIAESKPRDAMVTLKRVVRQMVFHDYRSDAAHAMALLALSHLMQGQFEQALEAQSKAEQLMENVDDMQSTAMLVYSRMTHLVAINVPIDETWFRTRLIANWKLFPAYIQAGFSAYKQAIRSKIGEEECKLLFSLPQIDERQIPSLFDAVNRSMEPYVIAEKAEPWYHMTTP